MTRIKPEYFSMLIVHKLYFSNVFDKFYQIIEAIPLENSFPNFLVLRNGSSWRKCDLTLFLKKWYRLGCGFENFSYGLNVYLQALSLFWGAITLQTSDALISAIVMKKYLSYRCFLFFTPNSFLSNIFPYFERCYQFGLLLIWSLDNYFLNKISGRISSSLSKTGRNIGFLKNLPCAVC